MPVKTEKTIAIMGGTPPAIPSLALGIVLILASLKVGLHVASNAFGPYEFHRDEFLYFAMGEHLRLLHMDFPPFIAILANGTRWVLGDSLVALRLPPMLMSTLLLVIASLTARELGGGRFAQGFAAFSVLASTLFLRSGNLFQPVVIDQVWWTLALFALVKLGSSDDRRWWLAFGVVCGFGLLSKFSILVLGFATFAALLLTPSRRWLKTPWPWASALLAFAIGMPSLVGQINLEFPILNQMDDLRRAQLASVSPVSFILDQPRMVAAFPIAVIAAAALAFGQRWRPFRLVGWTCMLAFVTLMVLRGKSYYAGPLYPVLVGAGSVLLERLKTPFWSGAVRWGAVGLLTGYLLLLFPLGLPILPPPTMERYLVTIGLQSAATTNIGDQERIPQDYADMLNWREQVEEVARVYHGLPAADRDRAVIWTSNYGEAGAIDFYGGRYGLPPARAFVGSYWFFGPGALPGDVIVLHGFVEDDFSSFCETLDPAGYVTHPYAVAEQRDLTIFVCRGPRQTLQELWPSRRGEN